MFLQLDGEGAHYGQLIRAMREAIRGGRLGRHTRLPSSRALALELGCSRTTALAAYEQLRAEGYIYGRQGSGSFVSDLAIEKTPRRVPGKQSIAPPSRFAARARKHPAWSKALRQPGLRFDTQYGSSQTNPALGASWGRELAWAATHTPLVYGKGQGLPALREEICRYLAVRRCIETTADRVLVVSGTQQAIALSARVLLDEGNTVALEEPHYFGAWAQLDAHGARVLPIPTDGEGLVCSALPAAAPRLVIVTPAHQFPSGAVLSLPRRIELLGYAEKKSCWILEDDYDSELRYDSPPLAPLRSLDQRDRVIYVGTLSKVMSGALRLGYMVLPEALRDDFVNAKILDDRGNPTIAQAALAHFMANGGFERHLRHVGKELHARHVALIEGLRRHGGQRVEITGANTGMHLVVWLPHYDHAQVEALIALAHERGLGLYSIAPHFLVPPAIPGLLLGYGGLSTTQLRDAMQVFGECLDTIDATTRRQVPARSANLRMIKGSRQ